MPSSRNNSPRSIVCLKIPALRRVNSPGYWIRLYEDHNAWKTSMEFYFCLPSVVTFIVLSIEVILPSLIWLPKKFDNRWSFCVRELARCFHSWFSQFALYSFSCLIVCITGCICIADGVYVVVTIMFTSNYMRKSLGNHGFTSFHYSMCLNFFNITKLLILF